MAVVPFVLLTGCSIGQNNEDKSIPIEKVDISRYEKKMAEGVFEGVLNTKFVDIKVNGELKMFYAVEDAVEQIKELKEGDKIRFEYALSERTFEEEIYSIVQLNGKSITEEKKPNKDKLDKKDEKEEDVEKIEMEVQYKDKTKIVKAVESEFFGGKINAIDTYDWDGQKLTNEDTEITFEEIEDTLEDDVTRERWRAAGILKEVGELKEQKETDIDGLKFLFYVKTDDQYKEILVLQTDKGYFRVETDTSKGNINNVKAEIEAMLETIK